ncbi:MAG: GNAT family N-acetyltransferase [Deltaproteobacteria bacterium]|nr:GNAT family N-acetyltransferase [Deltaproteobacteria bacterium]
MKDILIRELEIKDVEEISAIYSGIIQKPVKPDFKQLIQRHAERKEDLCFVAEINGRVIGFMVSYILTLGFGIEKSAWVATLGVRPDYMGQGIGKKLGEKIFEYYKALGIENVYTSVRWDSPDLLSFFKTLGFDRSNFINLRKQI